MAAHIPDQGSPLLKPASYARTEPGAPVDRVRCVIRHGHRFLLVQPNARGASLPGKWGLAGGRLEPPEEPRAGLRRELEEELKLAAPTLIELGDWRHGRETHRVFGCEIERTTRWFNTEELAAMGWFSYAEVAKLALSSRLHRGFELAAIRTFRIVAGG